MRVLCNVTVGEQDKVFEAGSGSGLMSLMLSKSGEYSSFHYPTRKALGVIIQCIIFI